MDTMANQRRFFRLDLDPPLEAQMSIVRIRNNKIETGEAHVLVDNISAGGLRFLSLLQLPVRKEVVLEFRMRLLNQRIKALGIIVRKEAASNGVNKYGVSFTIDEELKTLLVSLIGELQIKLRRGSKITSCDFYEGDVLDYFLKDLDRSG